MQRPFPENVVAKGMKAMFEIRLEKENEKDAVRRVNKQAFARQNEADLVDALRDTSEFIISLVALLDEEVVGHIMFSPVSIESNRCVREAMGLGPMAVMPNYQGRGVGAQLIKAGLQMCAENGFTIVFVLGHPTYYPRFGFVPTKPLGIQWEHDVPEELFMVVTLAETDLASITGIVKYHPVFNGV
jgi:putative acetyltransferase